MSQQNIITTRIPRKRFTRRSVRSAVATLSAVVTAVAAGCVPQPDSFGAVPAAQPGETTDLRWRNLDAAAQRDVPYGEDPAQRLDIYLPEGDINRGVIVAGASAGGTLAALLGTAHNAPGAAAIGANQTIDGWVSYGGVYDFSLLGRHVGLVRQAWLGPQTNDAAIVGAASPITHLDSSDAPGLVVHGDNDPIVPVQQAWSFVNEGRRRGVGLGLRHETVAIERIDNSFLSNLSCR